MKGIELEIANVVLAAMAGRELEMLRK